MRRLVILLVLALIFGPTTVLAQNLDSTNYTLIAPSVGSPIVGMVDSTSYTQLIDSNSVDTFTTTSTTYQLRGGTAEFIEANVPAITCWETSTNGGTTSCTGLPGSDGMHAVCSQPGCYNRGKLEIDAQGNAADARYAVQISTVSNFSSDVYYVDSTTRLLKSTLTVADFIPKCEWEGTIVSGVCGSANTTWQRYNILGLNAATTYYVRLSAHKGLSGDGTYTQSEWGPDNNATTANASLSLDIDIAPDTSTPTSAPHILPLGNLTAGAVSTTTDMIVLRITSNALSGIETQVSGTNEGLKHTVETDEMTAVNNDLVTISSGFGLRNSSASNSADNTGTIGDITVSAAPSDFTDAGAVHKVGAPTTTYVKVFDSNSMPLDTGISGYFAKAKSEIGLAAGVYEEILTFLVVGSY